MSELGGHYEECYKELYKSQTKEYNRRSSSIEFVCDICGKVSKGKDSHQSHLAAHAKKAKLQKKSIEEAPSSFFCDKCGKEFFTKSRLAVHVWHFHSKIIQCELCDYSCPKPGMRRHMRVHQEPKFECATCGKMLKTKTTLRAHEREHAGIRPFPCNVCNKSFSDNAALKQHKRLVHKITGPDAKPMRRELERGIIAFTIDDTMKQTK